jgi:hypothetical protein
MKAQEVDKIQRQLNMVEQWRACGMGAHAWAQAHGIAPAKLTSWIGHERLWRDRLAGKAPTPRAKPTNKPTATSIVPSAATGFAPVHLSVPPAPTTPAPLQTIRIEHHPSGLILHWPLSHSTQLAHLLGLQSSLGLQSDPGAGAAPT